MNRIKKYRSPRRGLKGRGWLKTLLSLLALAALGMTALSERALSAVSTELTQEAARGYILDHITQAVEAELEADPGPFLLVEREESGQVSLVSADQERLNRLRTGVLDRLSRDLRGQVTVQVPVGSLTGVGLLNGRGFPVPLKMRLEGSATAEFSTDFISAGLNQTCHRLSFTVRAQAYSPSRRFETAVEVESVTVLAETMGVGQVPKFITNGTGQETS